MSSDPLDGDVAEDRSRPIGEVLDRGERSEHLREVMTSFSHQCRNSLNGIKLSLYLYKRGALGSTPASLDALERLYRDIERSFDRLRVIYRPLSVTVIRHPLGQLLAERLPSWQSWFEARERVLAVEAPDHDLAGDFDPIQLGLGLDAFVAWRAEAGPVRSQPKLSWSVDDHTFFVDWDEGSDRTRAQNGSHTNGDHDEGAAIRDDSLALSVLARVVAAHGGHLERSGEQVLSVRIRWPRFQERATADDARGEVSAAARWR
jgi:hypothetical protein